MVSTEILSRTTIFNIDDNNISLWFIKDDTESWSNDLKMQLCITGTDRII